MQCKLLLGVAISGLLLFVALRKVDFSEFWASLQAVNGWYLLLSVVVTLVSFALRALRWQHLLSPLKAVSFRSSLQVTMIGFMANNLLPVRMGELVFAYVMGEKENISKSASLATVVLFRLCDGLILVLSLLVILLLLPVPLLIKHMAVVSAAVFGVVLGLFLGLEWKPQQMLVLLRKVLGLLPGNIAERCMQQGSQFQAGAKLLRWDHHGLWVVLTSLAVWVAAASAIFFTLRAFGFDTPWYAAFVVLTVVALGLMVPSSPGFIGSLQFFCVVALELYAIPKSAALGFSVVYHATQFIPVTVLGLVCLWWENMSLLRFVRAPTAVEEAGNRPWQGNAGGPCEGYTG